MILLGGRVASRFLPVWHAGAVDRRRLARTSAAAGALIAVGIGVVLLATGGDGPERADRPTGLRTTAPPTTTAPPPTAPAPTPTTTLPAAPFPVGRAGATAVDATRGTAARGPTSATGVRSLPLTVLYPATTEGVDTPAVAGTFPLVVFAHGFGIAAADYDAFTRDLAAQGFVVVAPDFPRSSTVFPGPPTADDIDEQARDVGFLISALVPAAPGAAVTGPTGPWTGHVAPGAAGAVGQSDGGNTVARAGGNSCCRSDRVAAVVSLAGDEGRSGGTWGVEGQAPLLLVNGTADGINPWSFSQRLYDDARPPKVLVAIDGGGHLEPFTSGPQRPAVVALTAAFLHGHLGRPASLALVTPLASRDGLSVAAAA